MSTDHDKAEKTKFYELFNNPSSKSSIEGKLSETEINVLSTVNKENYDQLHKTKNVIVCGFKETKNKNNLDAIKNLFKEITISDTKIKKATRLGKENLQSNYGKNRPRLVLVNLDSEELP
jgi:hypothetical protein